MVFTSLDYAFLLALTFVGYWTVPARYAFLVLLLASVVFYAYWSVPYLFLVAASMTIGFACARSIETRRTGHSETTRTPLVIAVVCLLGLLAYFKYAEFLLGALSPLTGWDSPSNLEIVLPLAISFYTFQILGYVIDVYRGGQAERSFARFTLFVGFFPQLIAGPIVRAHQLLPQLRNRPRFNAARIVAGLELLAYGIVKKTVVADNLALLVDSVYGDPAAAGGMDIILATLAFGAQIYCDFSGYTDIARGSARMLGIELPLNFRSPYLARSLTDFWRRWHITLSTWLRDYLYIPLGGNRLGPARLYANLLITMTLGGLWHGASITFVLWGAYHGVLLVAERAAKRTRGDERRRRWHLPVIGPLATFVAVQIGWGIFRAHDYATLGALASRLLADPLGREPLVGSALFLPLIIGFYCLHALSALLRNVSWIQEIRLRPLFAAPALAAAVAITTVFGASSDAFIYFQF